MLITIQLLDHNFNNKTIYKRFCLSDSRYDL